MLPFGLFLVALYACAHAQIDSPNGAARGAQIRLSKTGLQYMADVGVAALQRNVNNLHVPNQSGKSGSVSWDASNIVVHSLHVGPHSFTPLPNLGVRLSLRGVNVPVSFHAHAKYRKHFIKISTHSEVDATPQGVSVDVSLKVTATGSGKPHIAVAGCSSGMSDLSLHFHGGHSWIWKIVQGIIKHYLKKSIRDNICSAVTGVINKNANKYLDMFPTRKNIKNLAYIDYSLGQPTFTSDYMDFYARGEFLNYKHPVHSHLQPPSFQTTSSASKMAYIWLTDYSLNTAAEVFHNARLLTRVIKIGDKIPSGVKPFLNTRSIKGFIPQLYEKYPDRPIRISLETFKAPTFKLTSGQAEAALYVRAGINVELADKSLVSVFHLDLSVSGKGTASIKNFGSESNICGNISTFTFKIAVGGSSIGKVNLPVNNPSIQALVRGLVVEQANPYINNGFPLPQSNNFRLKSPSLTIVQNAIRIDSNVEYRF